MDFETYQKSAARTLKDYSLQERELMDYSLGLSEAGELQNKLKKMLFHEEPVSKAEIKEEMGDLLWYIAAIATVLNIKLDDVAFENIEKLKKRYPNGYSHVDSLKRRDKQS